MLPFKKVVRTLILTDLVIFAGWGFVSPVFAVYVLQSINGGNLTTVGVAAGIYLMVKSLAQVPIGRFLDINHGEKDDFWFMVVGMSVVGFVPLGYLLATQAWHIFVIQALYGLGMAMYTPSWGGIFTRHMNKGKEAETWSIESSAIGLGAGLTGMAGGLLAETFGFYVVFIFTSLLSFAGMAGYFFVRDSLAPREGQTIAFPKQ